MAMVDKTDKIAGPHDIVVHSCACSICGEKQSSAYWYGSVGYFHVCGDCAINVLPAIIADATISFIRSNVMDHAKWVLIKITSNYWKAIAHIMGRE